MHGDFLPSNLNGVEATAFEQTVFLARLQQDQYPCWNFEDSKRDVVGPTGVVLHREPNFPARHAKTAGVIGDLGSGGPRAAIARNRGGAQRPIFGKRPEDRVFERW